MFAFLVIGAALSTAAAVTAPKPHIISVLQDDLGWYDSGIHNPQMVKWTHNITNLAQEGIVLTNHYVHWHCSPTRRSFLTGRLPIHHGEQLSGDTTDDIDLRYTWVSGKLAKASYSCHWFGKWCVSNPWVKLPAHSDWHFLSGWSAHASPSAFYSSL